MIADELRLPAGAALNPVMILAPMAEWGAAGGKSYDLPVPALECRMHLIGALSKDYSFGEGLEAFDAAQKRIQDEFGLYLQIFVQPSQRMIDGLPEIGAHVCYAVTVADYAQAKDIPAFFPLAMWSGYQKTMPSTATQDPATCNHDWLSMIVKMQLREKCRRCWTERPIQIAAE